MGKKGGTCELPPTTTTTRVAMNKCTRSTLYKPCHGKTTSGYTYKGTCFYQRKNKTIAYDFCRPPLVTTSCTSKMDATFRCRKRVNYAGSSRYYYRYGTCSS